MAALIDVRKQFDDQVVIDRVSLDLSTHPVTALVGASGCGKSTLLRIAAGLLPTDEGEVQASPDRIGVVFQDARLLPWLTVRENLLLALPPRQPGRQQAVKEALEAVRLADAQDKFPRQLSGGMSQRVAIARALLRKPELLLMDEPFAALDAMTRAELQSMLRTLVTEQSLNCMFVTHDLNEAELISDRLVVMHGGRLIACYEKHNGFYEADMQANIRQLLNLR
ncbi:ABC transporter ATP-binding protein [Orrella sp. 11846]|uniref:ABC transporter ATP-binding protein n=1 Tax=Orrella sp. 11846 TaxID=3409913 RepID=UPI003B5C8F53